MLGGRAFGHGGVRNEHRVAATHDHVDSEWRCTRLVVNHGPYLAKGLAERARRAGDHRVGLTKREHRRREVVTVLVYHPLNLAAKHPVPLMLLIDVVYGAAHQRRITAVENLIFFRVIDADFPKLLVNILAPDE